MDTIPGHDRDAPPPRPFFAETPFAVGPVPLAAVLGLVGLALAHAPAVLWRIERTLVGPVGDVTFDGAPPPGSTFLESWFYVLAWWSYILLASAFLKARTGRALLFDRPRAFALLALHSAAFWLAFELVNLRLSNWYYVGVPPDLVSRGPGMLLAFATVLPGIFVTAELVALSGAFARSRTRRWTPSPGALRAISVTGLAFLVLPLAFPRWFYPLIWGALVLLAEPWLYRRGERCLLRFVAEGRWTVPLRLLAAGALAGLLWESWNSLASSRWIYTVPFFEELKLFEMPLLGFLGFPPFALECYTFARLAVALGWIPEWEPGVELRADRPRRALQGVALAVVVSVPAIVAVNLVTVRATQPRVAELTGIRPETVAALHARGIRTIDGLLRAFRHDADFTYGTPLEPGQDLRWIEEGHLMQVKGLGARGVRWLGAVGVERRAELAAEDAAALVARLAEVDGPPPRPTPAEVRVWVRGAQPDATAPCCAAVERRRASRQRWEDFVRRRDERAKRERALEETGARIEAR